MQIPAKQILSDDAYHDLITKSKVLVDCRHGPKVLLQDGLIYKFFYLNKIFSRRFLWPQSQAFFEAGIKLAALKIPSPQVDAYYYYPKMRADIVGYQSVEGEAVAQLLSQCKTQEEKNQLINRFFIFLSQLHQAGVFFKGIHLQNILLNDQQEFILIDIASVKIFDHPVTLHKRARNIKHLFRHALDGHFYREYGLTPLIDFYCDQAKLSKWQRAWLQWYCKQGL